MRLFCLRLLSVLFLLPAGFSGFLLGQTPPCSFSDSAILVRMHRDIRILASDSFLGREAGTPGDSLATLYILDRFRETGLEPKGTDSGSFLQPFDFTRRDFPRVENFLATDYDAFDYRRDFGITALSACGRADGKLLVIGSGIVDSVSGRDDYAGREDPEGRVLLMEFPLPVAFRSDASAMERLSVRNRCAEAFRRGALAILLWHSDDPGYSALFDFDRSDTLSGPVLFITERVARQLESLEGQPVRLGAATHLIITTCHNIVGMVDNGAPTTVVIGAHYDHEGLNRAGKPRCGADDNASGMALMLELARYLKLQGNHRFNYLFIAFGAEELGMIGSDYFCAHPVVSLERVAFMCNFDMVGRLGAEGNRITALGTATSPQWKEIYAGLPKPPFRVKRYKGASSFSDQKCFYSNGIPLFCLTTGMHPDYHTHRDRPERINYTGMAGIVRYAEAFINGATEKDSLAFRKVSGWKTLFADLDYYVRQIGHLFEIPAEDWP